MTADTAWAERNRAQLVRAFATLRQRFGETLPEPIDVEPIEPPAAIDTLSAIFGLSAFERELLLLCAGAEMDAGLAARGPVTFALALAVLDSPHWSALTPAAPLRRFRLIEIEPGHGLTAAPLHIDERVLHYLAGLNRLDQRLAGLLSRKFPSALLAEEHRQLISEVIEPALERAPPAIAVHLCGDDALAQESVAAAIADRAGHALFVLRLEDTPAQGSELDQFIELWAREALLLPALLLLQWAGDVPSAAARALAERLPGPLLIASRDTLALNRPLERFKVDKPDPPGQRRLWDSALGPAAGDVLDALSAQFRLSAETISSLAASVGGPLDGARLWRHCRAFARPRLESLTERIEPVAGWDDLVLPEMQKLTLRRLAAQSRHRMTVYEEWGFSARGRRGLGLSALFSGPSGTGKTLAAEVLAAELDLDLYRIDLSAVVSKYIGETEKNLKQLFDAAETGGVALLFDEADALFGKRGEVRDSHDRYANIEVSYLLQRMESFQGLAILTTNLKSSLDKAFQRRLRFAIDFPFPDTVQREAIWRHVFPPETPTRDLQPARLASLNMTGGNIRNIALNAAFLAAEAGAAVEIGHVLQAARMEALKIERPLSETEIRGWV